MNNYQDEQEVNIKDMFCYALRQYKKILVGSGILAILLALFMGYKAYEKQESLNEYATATQEDLKNFEKEKDALTEALNNKILNSQNYMNNSAFLNLDSYNAYEATATYYVSTDYEIILEYSYQNYDYTNAVLNAYTKMLKEATLIDSISKKVNISSDELNDYINVYTENHLLTIEVFGSNESTTQEILREMKNSIPSIQKQIESTIGKNEISYVSETLLKGTQSKVNEIQEKKISSISTMIKDINTLQTNLNSLTEPQIYKSPVMKGITSSIKYGVLGLFVGIFVILFIYCVLFILKDTVYSSDELKDKLKVRILGNISSREGKQSKLVSWINKKEHRTSKDNNEWNYQLIASNMKAYIGNETKVLISSNTIKEVNDEIMKQLKNLLPNVQIILCGDLNEDATGINELINCNDVVIVAECNKTTYKSLQEQKEKIIDLNKNLIGVITLD